MIELAFEDTHFQDIKNGKKTVIGKIDADLQGIKKGDTVIFKDVGNKANSGEKINVKVKDIKKFTDIPTMLKEMKLKSILPRSKSYKDGEKVFEETYGNRLKDAKFTAFTFEIVENKEPNGPRVKNKKNGEPNGPRVKNKKNGEPNGPNVKNKKNSEPNEVENEDENEEKENEEENSENGPQVKNKKNGNSSNGPRVKNKKNGNSPNGPRVKDKKNGDRPPMEMEMNIQEPWFSLIENGQKEVEGRLNRGKFQELRVDDTIRFVNKINNKEKSLTAKITKLTKYPNFGDLLFHEKLYRVLPGFPNIKCGITLYDKYYKFDEVKEFGTLAIELKVQK
jgi:ASC-1-like (ASCH) protein